MDSKIFSKKIRLEVIKMAYEAKSSHIASALSIVDIISVLYNDFLIYDSNNEPFPEKNISLNQPENPINLVIENLENIFCKNEKNGSFQISVAGGVAPYSYFINKEFIKEKISYTRKKRRSI